MVLTVLPWYAPLHLDNCSVNKVAVGILAKPMIGAHCLNLAATHWTREAFNGKLQGTMDQIHACMKRASTLKNRAKVRKYTAYVPIMKNKTRWTGNQTMAIQYNCMHKAMDNAEVFEDISDSDMEEIDDGYSTSLKNVKPSLLRGQIKRNLRICIFWHW